jgi:hypothetical protein
VAALRTILRMVLMPAYMFAAPFVRISLWVLGWALALAAVGSWAMAPEIGATAWWRGVLFALGAGLCHWLRAALPMRRTHPPRAAYRDWCEPAF